MTGTINEAELKTITPEEAARILENNTHNRQCRQTVVKRYARQMAAGEWRLTGETIKIAADGSLLDGQHRLLACIEAATPFDAYIVTGLDPGVFDVIDSGVPRRTADALHVKGEKSTALLAAVLGWVFLY